MLGAARESPDPQSQGMSSSQVPSADYHRGRMDELAAIRVFTRVVELGSFSKVARQLETATSSVARHIDALEEELGVRLFNRTTRQLVLTEAGARFYEDSARIVQSMEDAKRNAISFQEGVRG